MARKVTVSEDALKGVLQAVLNGGHHMGELLVVHNLNKKIRSPNPLSQLCDEWDDESNHFDDSKD